MFVTVSLLADFRRVGIEDTGARPPPDAPVFAPLFMRRGRGCRVVRSVRARGLSSLNSRGLAHIFQTPSEWHMGARFSLNRSLFHLGVYRRFPA